MPKSLFIRFSMILPGMLMLLLPHLATAETWYVKKSSTKLQAEASARSKVLVRLKQGTPVKVKKKSRKFFQVSAGGKTGWIFRFKLSKKAPAQKQGEGDVLGTLGGEPENSRTGIRFRLQHKGFEPYFRATCPEKRGHL